MRAIMALATCLVLAVNANAGPYDDARAAMVAAYQAGDYPAMRAAAQRAVDAAPDYPGALFNRALAEVLDDDAETALDTLSAIAAMGVDIGAANIPQFAPVQELPGWSAYAAAVTKLHEPVGYATVAEKHDGADFVPEGIAVGAGGELYLGSIRHGTLVRLGKEPRVLSDANGHWSVFGMRLDRRGGIWFASAAVPEFAAVNEESLGQTGLFRLDLESNEISHRAVLPMTGDRRVLGDLVLLDADTVLTTESLSGAVYNYSIKNKKFTELLPPGTFRSAQGLVLDATRRFLYVADYVGGLYRLDLEGGSLVRVTAASDVCLYGIDGLYRHGKELIAIQNGIRPHRVVGLTLADDGVTVASSRVLARNLPDFDEPTLGVVVDDEFYFVANSHWNRFDADGTLPDDLTGPIILKLQL